jgi:hypothetical protein
MVHELKISCSVATKVLSIIFAMNLQWPPMSSPEHVEAALCSVAEAVEPQRLVAGSRRSRTTLDENESQICYRVQFKFD